MQTGFTALQISLDNVNTNVTGLTNKVDTLFEDMGKQQEDTTELKGKVATLENGFLELTQTVQTLKAASPTAMIPHDTNAFQDQLLMMTNSITNSFKIAIEDIHNRPTTRPTTKPLADPKTPAKRVRSNTASPQDSTIEKKTRKTNHTDEQNATPSSPNHPPTVKNTSRQHDLALVDKVIEDLNQEQIDASDILTAASESPIQDTSQATEQSPTSEALVTQEIGVATPVPKRIENRVQQLNEDENPAGFDYEVSRQSEFNAAAGALADNPGEKATPASLFNRVIDASNQYPSPARSNASDSTGHRHDTRFAKAHKLPLPSPLFNGNKASEE